MLILISIVILGAIVRVVWQGHRVTTQSQRWAASSQADKILQSWATNLGVSLIESDQRIIAKGPFIGRGHGDEFVYRITAVYGDGRVRSGWVLCGARPTTKPLDQVEVRWDELKTDVPGFPVIMRSEQESGDGGSQHS